MAFLQDIKEILELEQIKLEEPMKKHTTFGVGGNASYYLEPNTIDQLQKVIQLCNQYQIPFEVIGNGSNLLVSDDGYNGCIIPIGKMWSSIEVSGNKITTGAGAILSAVANKACKASLKGAEFASGIPGTIGGAVVMNAGAYGGEMKDIVTKATVLTKDGLIKEVTVEELELGYRTSCIKKHQWIVLNVSLELLEGNEKEIKGSMDSLNSQRKEKQPLEYKSAGSTFKRPPNHFAGKLIQDSGLRGYRVGDAQVSEKHCGFVINRGNATASDILNLCEHVKKVIKDTYEVELELEVKLLGFKGE